MKGERPQIVGEYGRHLREVVDSFHKNAPLSDHRCVCKCDRCRDAQVNGWRK